MSNAGDRDDMRGTDNCNVEKEQLQVRYTIIPAQSPSEPSFVLKTSTGTKGFMAQTILDQEGFPVDPRLTSRRVAIAELPGRTGPILPVQDTSTDQLSAHQSRTANGYVINVQRFAASSDMKEEPLFADWKERQSSDNCEWKERGDFSRKEGSGNRRGNDLDSSLKRRTRSPESSTRGRSPRRRRSRSLSRSRSRSPERRRSRSRSRERRRNRSRSRRRKGSRSRSRERRRSRSRSKDYKRSSSSFVDGKTESSRKKSRDDAANSPWRDDVGTSAQKVLLSNGEEIEINVPNKPRVPKKNQTASWKPERTEPVESVVKKSTYSFFKKFSVDWEKHSLAKGDEVRTEQEVKNSISPEEKIPISLEHLNLEDETTNVPDDNKNHNSSSNKNSGEVTGEPSSIVLPNRQVVHSELLAQPEQKSEEAIQKTLVDVAFKHKKKLLAPMPKERKKGPVVLKIKTAEDQLEEDFKKTKEPRFDATDLNDYVTLVDVQLCLTQLDDFSTLFATFKERYCKELCYLEFYIHKRKDISVWGQEQLKKRIGMLFIQFSKMECSAAAVEDSFHCGCEMIVSMDEMKSLKLLDDKGLNQILDPSFTDCEAVVNVPSTGAWQTCCASALKKNLRMIQSEPKIFCGMHSKRIQAHKGCPCGIFPVDVQLLVPVEKGFARCPQGHFYHEACFWGCPHEPCKPSRSAILRPSAAK